MSRMIVRWLSVPAVVTLAAAVLTADPRPLAGAEVVHEAELFAAAGDPELTAVNRDLSARLEAVAARTALKEDLCDRLLAGRIRLAVAADGFLRLNQDAPECLDAMRLHYPASDDREAAARNVLTYLMYRVPAADWPRQAARLAGEYRELFGHAPVLD